MADRPARVHILFGLAYPDSRVRRTAHALAGAGYRVTVLAWDRSGSRPRRERDGDVAVEHALVRSASGRGWRQLFTLVRATWTHLPTMRQQRPDVLHVVDLPLLAIALAIRPLIGNPRLVYDAFELYSVMEAHKYPGWLLGLLGVAERRLPRRADLVVTPGAARQAWFAARGVPSVVVGNWVDPPGGPVDRGGARERLGIGQDAFVVAYAGGLEPSRDLAALVRHAERSPDTVVVVAGRGEQEPMLRAASDRLPNLRFLGWVPDPADLYAAADAMYYALAPDHPYAAHPAPNNLYTAIAWTVPMIHRGQGEIGELAHTLDLGERFDDDAGLDQAAGRLRDPHRREEIRSAMAGVREAFTARRAAGVLVSAYPTPPRVEVVRSVRTVRDT